MVKCNFSKIFEFRPIRLYNVVYKLFSKVLANMLKKLLAFVVFENQSAFQARRVITTNILILFETLDYMKHQQYGKSSFMTLKRNMNKAYDRVEWFFMEILLKKNGIS